jgi:hypothetical protein
MGQAKTEEGSKMKTKLVFAAVLAVLALSPPTFAYLIYDEEQDLLESLSTPEAA